MKLLQLSKMPDETAAIIETPRWNYCYCQYCQIKLLQLSKLPDEKMQLSKLPDGTTIIVKTCRWNYCNHQNSQMKLPQSSKHPDETVAIVNTTNLVDPFCHGMLCQNRYELLGSTVRLKFRKSIFFAMIFKQEETAPNKFSNNIQQFVLVNNNKFWQKNSSLSLQSAYDFQYFYHKSSLHL